jgi:hypothetical protein
MLRRWLERAPVRIAAARSEIVFSVTSKGAVWVRESIRQQRRQIAAAATVEGT